MMKNDNKIANQKLNEVCELLEDIDALDNIKMSNAIRNKLENVKDWAKVILND